MFNTVKMLTKVRFNDIYVKEEDFVKTLKCIKSFTGVDAIKFNVCNWSKAPELYRVRFICLSMDLPRMYSILDGQGIKLYPSSIKWTGYQDEIGA